MISGSNFRLPREKLHRSNLQKSNGQTSWHDLHAVASEKSLEMRPETFFTQDNHAKELRLAREGEMTQIPKK